MWSIAATRDPETTVGLAAAKGGDHTAEVVAAALQ
jgi:hypothetical protein